MNSFLLNSCNMSNMDDMDQYCTPELYLTNTQLDHLPIAMAYIPWQQWGQTYDLELGLMRGTIFPDLDLPYRSAGGK